MDAPGILSINILRHTFFKFNVVNVKNSTKFRLYKAQYKPFYNFFW